MSEILHKVYERNHSIKNEIVCELLSGLKIELEHEISEFKPSKDNEIDFKTEIPKKHQHCVLHCTSSTRVECPAIHTQTCTSGCLKLFSDYEDIQENKKIILNNIIFCKANSLGQESFSFGLFSIEGVITINNDILSSDGDTLFSSFWLFLQPVREKEKKRIYKQYDIDETYAMYSYTVLEKSDFRPKRNAKIETLLNSNFFGTTVSYILRYIAATGSGYFPPLYESLFSEGVVNQYNPQSLEDEMFDLFPMMELLDDYDDSKILKESSSEIDNYLLLFEDKETQKKRATYVGYVPTDDEKLKKFNLNEQQNHSVKNISNFIECIQGPPGTGKSTTIVAYAITRIPVGSRTLICTTTNKAIDSLVTKFAKYVPDSEILSFGSRLEKDSQKYLLFNKVEADERVRFVRHLIGKTSGKFRLYIEGSVNLDKYLKEIFSDAVAQKLKEILMTEDTNRNILLEEFLRCTIALVERENGAKLSI